MQVGERPKLTEELEALAESEKELDAESETLRFLTKLFHHCTEKNPDDRPSAKKIFDLLLTRTCSASASEIADK